MAQRSFLIVGAGISGLATAWFLKQAGFDVQILEARDEVGGNLRTLHQDGYLVERGPNSTLNNRPALDELLDGLGLKALEANNAAKRRYVLRDQQLHALPGSPVAFVKTPLFSARGKWRLLLEPFIGRATKEESVAQFVQRRLGKEFLDWAINPFVSGVYAGDPARLSVRAATSKVYALERDYRSLLLGALTKVLFHKHRGGAGPSGSMISFPEGMQQLSDTLAQALEGNIETGVAVESIKQLNGSWQVRSGERHWQADQLVLCTPAHADARLLKQLAPTIAEQLEPIVYPTVASVSLGFRREQIEHPLDGFGFLIPRCTGVETLGVLFPSSIFPGRAPDNHCLLTIFIGGVLNNQLGTLDEAEIKRRVLRDISPLLGIKGEPELVSINRWTEAIPQYELGHLQRLERVDQALQKFPGLHLRGNWRGGISVSDCIQNAREFARGYEKNSLDV
jgi:oxygen-dependent protoporphyrinogen oxidase